jgi:hypothetical protein
MAVGRISGPLLKANLLRDGVPLAFETDLLYLDVVNGRVGIKTASPDYDLDVNGTARTTNLIVPTNADIATFTFNGNTISSTAGQININPSTGNAVLYQAKLYVNNNLEISSNSIKTTVADDDLELSTLGTGQVQINSNVLVNGNLHATGSITADGSITIGDSNTDSIIFNADIASNIVPDANNTYDLGEVGKEWRTSYIQDVQTTTLSAANIQVNGIDLALPQGNIIYVAKNGNDTNAGLHENNPVATIEHAFTLATAGNTVYVFPGVYEERFPLEVPSGVTVHGTSLRSVTIKPTAATMYLDAFHVNGQATVEDFTIMGFHHDSTGTLPEFTDNSQGTGHAFRFSSNTTTKTRSPYIRNITVLTFGTASVLAIDGQVTETIDGLTRIKSLIDEIVTNGTVVKTPGNSQDPVTGVASDAGTGTLLQGLIDDVIHIINNGTLKANLPTITANGTAVTSSMLYNAAVLLEANRAFIKEEITAYVTATYPSPGFTYDIAKCQRDMGYILDAMIYDIVRGGNEHTVYAGLAHWVQPENDPRGYGRGDAGHGALIDGSAVTADSTSAAMLFHSVTFITPAADTLIATNGARVEWLNSFTYFAGKGLYAYSSDLGFAGAGKTRLRINTRVGTWAVGNTVSYYDTDGTTLLASGVIEAIDGNYVDLTGRCLGFESITDRAGKTVYVQGNAKLSTAQKKFGTASLALDGSGDYAKVLTTTDFGFVTSDFTIEAWVYRTASNGSNQEIFDFRTTSAQVVPLLYLSVGGIPIYAVNTASVITGGAAISNNTWTHIAVSKSGNSTKLFVNGTQSGSTYTDNNTYLSTAPVQIGARYDGVASFLGYIDDVRVTKGIARYTTTFTPPATALTGDLSTVLLLHFNGNNNSTTILDDGITFQDLRTSAGGTASLINFADYSQFGAEVRAIGSANIYGNYGAYGDGPGVIAYLVSNNFAYVGAGSLTSNDPTDRIDANEVIELNGAKIYRTSVDNEGNFRVGDNFYVNQKTGEVLFDNQAVSVTSVEGVVFTDGVNTTTLTPSDITTGNIRISGNTVSSLTGDINVSAASGAINLQNTTFVTGDLDITGDLTIGGNIQIGDQTTDTISFVGGINSDLIPATNTTYDLGTPSLRWNNAYLSRIEVDGVVIDSNTISTTVGNDDLSLVANGTGRVYIPSNDVQIDQSLTVTQNFTVSTGTSYLKNIGVTGTITHTGDFNQTGNFTTSGTVQSDNLTVTGTITLPQIQISANTISTLVSGTDLNLTANGTGNVVFEGIKVSNNDIQSTVTNSNITLTPQGTGTVIVNSNQSIQIPVGTTLQRPGVGTATNGMIRYNTDLGEYEGYNNGYWLKLGGVADASRKTRILPELTPGSNNNTLYFYANDNLTAFIDSTKLFAEKFQTTNLDVNNNVISSINTNTDINITTSGTGGVRVGNLKIFNNTITNTVAGAVTEFVQGVDGFVRIPGTNGVVIPSGDTLTQRPSGSNAERGMMRFNTDGQLVEVYNGVSWSSVAGASGGVTTAEATELGIASALIFG